MFGTKFWEQIASGVAKKLTDLVISPASIFWIGGFLAIAPRWGCWEQIASSLKGIGIVMQILLAIGVLILVACSAILVESLQQKALHFLEGYWPRSLAPLRRFLLNRNKRRFTKVYAEWNDLAKDFSRLTREQLERYVHLDAELSMYPSEKRLLPTRLGNRLRAAEDYSYYRYGLAVGVIWPRMWLLIPEPVQKTLSQSNEQILASMRLITWSLAFLVWMIWSWWAVPLALIGIIWGYYRSLDAAGVYGELLRASIDLYRNNLYKALRFPMPIGTDWENESGQRLTEYLWRGGEVHQKIIFTPKAPKGPGS